MDTELKSYLRARQNEVDAALNRALHPGVLHPSHHPPEAMPPQRLRSAAAGCARSSPWRRRACGGDPAGAIC
ncbi:MAG: hypothetical protein R3F11_26535 [Verrucomicrobiales bacterium]